MDLYMIEGRLALFATSLTLLHAVESEVMQYLFPDAMEEILRKKLKTLDESLFLDKIWKFLASPSDSLKWREVFEANLIFHMTLIFLCFRFCESSQNVEEKLEKLLSLNLALTTFREF